MTAKIALLIWLCEFLYVCDNAINIDALELTGGDGEWSSSMRTTTAATTTASANRNDGSAGSIEYNDTSDNCTNEYCLSDDDYIDLIIDHISPTPFEWILILMNVVTFVVGLVGNALVCVAVYKNRAMRNVTNYFIVNLAVADFMVILFCLPATVVWDVTETWFFGTALCKIVLYFQVSGRAFSKYPLITRR